VAIDQPPVTSNIFANANEDTNYPTVQLPAVFTDADLSDTFTFTTDVTGTAGLVTNNHDGTFTYDPNGKFEPLSVGDTATDTFKYTVTDTHGASSTATATVTIHGENDAPSALPDVAVVQKGAVVTADAAHGVRINDSDPDNHDTLRVSKVNGLSTNVGHAVIGAYGTLTLNADGSYSYSANKNIPGLTNKAGALDQFAYSVDDRHGGTASSTLTVTVQTQQALNNGPVLSIHQLDADRNEGNSGASSNPNIRVFTQSGSNRVGLPVG
jgi:VCBS repeat-containing protein